MRSILMTLICGFMACLFGPADASAETRAVFVLDATAQMSARLGQFRKIDAMRSATIAAVQRMDPEARVSVWAFGTDPVKKCEDRGVLLALKAVSAAAKDIDKTLSPIQPRAARAPVFGTVRAALSALGDPKDQPASVILIAGTGDDCISDICSEAKRLHETYSNVKMTVLGLGMSEQAAAKYTCAAKEMGGGFTQVKSATELEKQLRQSLDIAPGAKPVRVTAALASPAAGAEPEAGTAQSAPAQSAPAGEQPAEAPSAPKPVPLAPIVEPNLVLSAVLAEGSPVLETGVTWELYKINTTPTGQLKAAETPSWTGAGGQAKAKLPEGRYIAAVRYGFASAATDVAVGPGKTETTIPLNAGTIAAEAYQSRDQHTAEGVFFTLYRPKNGGGRELLGRSSQSPALFHVNSGDYMLSASAGLAKLDAPVHVEAGKIAAAGLVLNLGIVQIDTFSSASTPADAWHGIYAAAAKPGEPPLLRLSGGSQRLQLPAGSYRVETVYGNASLSTPLTVTPGQIVPLRVVLDAGTAKIRVPAGKPAHICAVYESSSSREPGPAGRAAGMEISFILKAGVYDLECRPANGTSSPTKRQITVASGETKEARLDD